MRAGEAAGERNDCAGEGWSGAATDEGTVRVFGREPEAGLEFEGCECGRKRGLGGVGTACCDVGVPVVVGWGLLCCCCDGWPGVELDCGAPESAMGTSAGGTTTRGALALDVDDGRTGVWCTAGDSCVC